MKMAEMIMKLAQRAKLGEGTVAVTPDEINQAMASLEWWVDEAEKLIEERARRAATEAGRDPEDAARVDNNFPDEWFGPSERTFDVTINRQIRETFVYSVTATDGGTVRQEYIDNGNQPPDEWGEPTFSEMHGDVYELVEITEVTPTNKYDAIVAEYLQLDFDAAVNKIKHQGAEFDDIWEAERDDIAAHLREIGAITDEMEMAFVRTAFEKAVKAATK